MSQPSSQSKRKRTPSIRALEAKESKEVQEKVSPPVPKRKDGKKAKSVTDIPGNGHNEDEVHSPVEGNNPSMSQENNNKGKRAEKKKKSSEPKGSAAETQEIPTVPSLVPVIAADSKEIVRITPAMLPANFNEDRILQAVRRGKDVASPKSFKDGRNIFACCGVSDVRAAPGDENGLDIQGIVNDFDSGSTHYTVRVYASDDKIKASCTCPKRGNLSKMCKHKTALLFALLLIKDNPAEAPAYTKRTGIDRIKDKNSQLFKKSKLEISLDDMKKRINEETKNDNDGVPLTICQEPPPSTRKQHGYCYCNTPITTQEKNYVKCSSRKKEKSADCKKRYHLSCLGEKNINVVTKTSWLCEFCVNNTNADNNNNNNNNKDDNNNGDNKDKKEKKEKENDDKDKDDEKKKENDDKDDEKKKENDN